MDYTLLKVKIIENFTNKKYNECHNLLKNLLKTVLKDNKIDNLEKNNLIWYYYFYKTNIYKQEKKYIQAKEFCLASFKYIRIQERDPYSTKYKMTLYLLAKIYEILYEKEKSIKLYKYLLNLVQYNNKHYLICLYCIQKLQENITMFNTKIQYKQEYNIDIEEDMDFTCYF